MNRELEVSRGAAVDSDRRHREAQSGQRHA
jgi:hypothetical protein